MVHTFCSLLCFLYRDCYVGMSMHVVQSIFLMNFVLLFLILNLPHIRINAWIAVVIYPYIIHVNNA